MREISAEKASALGASLSTRQSIATVCFRLSDHCTMLTPMPRSPDASIAACTEGWRNAVARPCICRSNSWLDTLDEVSTARISSRSTRWPPWAARRSALAVSISNAAQTAKSHGLRRQVISPV